jgi:hypothetical protein
VLGCLVAPRLRDLAEALVDLPFGILHGRPARTRAIPALALKPGSRLLAEYRRDY